jgi:hypothetical protein
MKGSACSSVLSGMGITSALRWKGGHRRKCSLLPKSCGGGVTTILWIIAAILVIAGIVTLLRGGIVAGIVLIIVGLLVGPGGVSVFC